MTVGHAFLIFILFGFGVLLLVRKFEKGKDSAGDSWIKTLTMVFGFLAFVWIAVFVMAGMDSDAPGAAAGITALFGGLFLYVLPTIIAIKRNHKSKNAIFVVNIFLGWVGLGWIASLIWSIAGKADNNSSAA